MTTIPSVESLNRRIAGVRAADATLGLLASAGFGTAVALVTASPAAGALAGAGIAVAVAVRASRLDAARRLERFDPGLDGAVTAFVEGGGGRLREDLAEWVLTRRPRASYRRSIAALATAAIAILAGILVRSLPHAPAIHTSSVVSRAAVPVAVTPVLRVSVEVAPPAYARRPPARVDSPDQPVVVLKGSTATLVISSSLPSVELTEEGNEARTLTVEHESARWTTKLEKSTAVRIGADRVVMFQVVPDLAPEVELTLPREDRSVTTKPAPFDVKAAARDDIGLESFALFYTLAHGRGEGMTFRTGRIDGPRTTGRSADLSTRLDPEALGLGRGDTLVLWAEATDGNAVDGPGHTASSARILRFEEDLARLEMKSSAPVVRPLNGPLSQREILARTLRLLGERLPKAKLRERSLELAQEQGKLRDAFGFFLHAEDGNAVDLDVEEKEVAEQGSDRARRLVAEAVSAMWSSESELSTGNPQGAVPHQRLALKKLDEAFGSERYALRSLAPPKAPVDEGRRLKGDAKGLAPRTTPDAPADRSLATSVSRIRSLARRLLLFSENLSSVPARSLADELWSLPEGAAPSRSALAAPLYAARSPEESARAARVAAETLLRILEPHPATRPAVAPGEAAFLTRLDAEARPPGRGAPPAPAR